MQSPDGFGKPAGPDFENPWAAQPPQPVEVQLPVPPDPSSPGGFEISNGVYKFGIASLILTAATIGVAVSGISFETYYVEESREAHAASDREFDKAVVADNAAEEHKHFTISNEYLGQAKEFEDKAEIAKNVKEVSTKVLKVNAYVTPVVTAGWIVINLYRRRTITE